MIKTLGLTHIHLMVKDIQQSLNFYKSVFGMQERFWSAPELVFLNTPGSNDMIALHQSTEGESTGSNGDILHFGFALVDGADLDLAINEVVAAGGKLEKRGEFGPGLPYAYVSDPDGYMIEI